MKDCFMQMSSDVQRVASLPLLSHEKQRRVACCIQLMSCDPLQLISDLAGENKDNEIIRVMNTSKAVNSMLLNRNETHRELVVCLLES